MSFALVLAPPRMPSSSHSSLLHTNRRKHMSASPSPSRTPPATAHAPTQQQQAPRPGVITLNKPLHAFAHNDRSHRREYKSKDTDKEVSASLPTTPLPNESFDEPSGKEEKKRKGRHNRTRSAANTPGAAQSSTPAERPASPSTSPSRRPALPHLSTEPASPTQSRQKKGSHKRVKSSAPSRGSQPHTPNNGASSAPEDDLSASATKAPEPLAANAQEQVAAAAGSAPISTTQSLNDSRTTTLPLHISDNSAPFTPTGSASVPIPASAPVSNHHSKKGRNLRNSMITIPTGVNISGNNTPAKGNKTGNMRIPRTKSQPFHQDVSQLSRSVPASQTLMMHPSGSSPLINVTPARDVRPARHYQSERMHKPALSLAFPPAPMASLPGASSLPSTPIPRQDASFSSHARGATYPAGGMFPLSMSDLEESFAYSSLDDSDHSAPDASGDDTDEQIVFFGQRVHPDLERVDRDLTVGQAKREKQETKVKLAGKEEHRRQENKRREKQVKHEERAQAKEAKAIKKIVYAGPQFYNSPAPDALPPPTF